MEDDELMDIEELVAVLSKYKKYLTEENSSMYFGIGYLAAKGYSFKAAAEIVDNLING